jgi:hypothetical protein
MATNCIGKSGSKNVLTNENGEKVRLKLGADIDVVVEADTDATTKITE